MTMTEGDFTTGMTTLHPWAAKRMDAKNLVTPYLLRLMTT